MKHENLRNVIKNRTQTMVICNFYHSGDRIENVLTHVDIFQFPTSLLNKKFYAKIVLL